MTWSEEQKKVIDVRGCSLLVSAAAGSGKTAVLVERIISRITDSMDPVSLDELLVMTFTRAAAEEMRERIGQALSKRIESDPDNSWLKLQRAILPRARISTIDSICQSLIRQYYQELEIDPGFRAADENELKLLRRDILDTMMAELHEEAGEDFLMLKDSLSRNGMDERISGLIEKLSVFADSTEWPERFLQEQEEICLQEAAGTPENTVWFREVLGWVRRSVESYEVLLSRAEELCGVPAGPAPYLANILECRDLAAGILGCSTYDELYAFVRQVSFSRLGRIIKDRHDPQMTAFVREIRDSFKAFVTGQLRDRFLLLRPEDLRLSTAGSARIELELIRLTGEFRTRYAAHKRERNQVDFSDMEHLALRLLYEETEEGMRPSALADELAHQFREIMIDEYQDSNAVQEALLTALSAERFGRPDVFMVGDVKQSIYRFRQAEPHLFIEKYHRYKADGDHRRIELNRNYRSRPEVVDSVNDVFDRIMREELGGVEYDEAARLFAGASYPPAPNCRTEFLIMDPGSGAGDDTDGEEEEYRMIARRILQLCGSTDSGAFTVQDKETGQARQVQFRDIAVLMRAAKGHAEKLVDILSKYSIPAYFDNSTGYFSAPEVEVMLSALSVIDNPQQDTPLAAVLRSAAVGFTDDELGMIRASYNEKCLREGTEPGNFYTALTYAAEENDKARVFLAHLKDWRELADVLPVHVLLEKLYSETGYYNYVAAGPGGPVRRKNLDMLLEKAESFSASNYHGLFRFSRYIELQKKYDTDHGEAGAVTENDNIVRVMTVHGSKGLEFPVVFLARMATYPPTAEREEAILADRGIGLGGDYIDPETGIRYPGLKKLLIREIRSREDQGEQLRLFYVAMTRAREKLIMTAAREDAQNKAEELRQTALAFYGEMKAGEKLPVQLIRKYRSWMDWLLLAMAGGSDSIDIRFLAPEDAEEEAARAADDRRDLLRKLLMDPDPAYGTGEDNKETAVLSDWTEKQRKLLGAVYAHEAEISLKPKISVSEIKMRSFSEEEDTGTSGTQETDYDDAASAGEEWYRDLWQGNSPAVSRGALKGTAFHRAMELLSYQGTAEEQLEELRTGGRMDPASLELLDEEAVKTFLASGLGRRMAEAEALGQLRREQHFMVGIPAGELDPAQTSGELQILQGIIDAYIEEEDRIVLIDYKTDYAPDPDILIRHYRTQLELYAGALRQLTGKDVAEKLIYSTYLQKTIPV